MKEGRTRELEQEFVKVGIFSAKPARLSQSEFLMKGFLRDAR